MKKILIIEDDINLLASIYKALIQRGYTDVTPATEGRQGLYYIKKFGPYDLISTGIMLPIMNGLDLLKKIKSQKVKHGPIVVLSAINQPKVVDLLPKYDVSLYIDKNTVTIDQLIDKFIEVMGKD